MLSKFSNTATAQEIEDFFGLKLEHSYLYATKNVIKGSQESAVCVITSEEPSKIQYAIWGICPKDFEDSWKSFQSIYNTLEIECESIPETSWLFQPLKYRRCLIIATGYFTSVIENNKIYDVKHELKTKGIFCFAGIYNVLEDGFITCSILSHTNGSTVYHLKDANPIIIRKDKYDAFLNKGFSTEHLCESTFELEPDQFNKEKIKTWNSLYKEL